MIESPNNPMRRPVWEERARQMEGGATPNYNTISIRQISQSGCIIPLVDYLKSQGEKYGEFSTMAAKANPNVEIVKTDAEWRQELTPEQYRITRQHGTERAGTGPHLHEKQAGIYHCICCRNALFDAKTKFDSGTGWPSFFQPIADENVAEFKDRSLFMVRTEVRCARCDAHLGHVFPDGPAPTGQRYCMNGHALTFDAGE